MTDDTRWIARLVPSPGFSVEDLLRLPLGLDVWERQPSQLVVAMTADQFHEIERRKLARIELIETVAEFLSRQQSQSGS